MGRFHHGKIKETKDSRRIGAEKEIGGLIN